MTAGNFPPRAQRPLRIGYLPLLDSAPLVVAHSLGFFEREGLATALCRQPGWACVRDKMLYGEIDAAQAPAGFLFAINAGATPNVGRCLTAFVISAQGNGIVLSKRLADFGICDLATFAIELRNRHKGGFTLGIVSRHSSHAHLLRGWLQAGGIDPEKEVRIVVLPPQQMVISLSAGHIDGFCAGEPWNSLAVSERSGWVVADSATLAPMHPEKVLMVHEDFAREAARRTHEPVARAGSGLRVVRGPGQPPCSRQTAGAMGVCRAFGKAAPEISFRPIGARVLRAKPPCSLPADKARWVLGELRRHKLLPTTISDAKLLANFRTDLYDSMRKDLIPY